MFEDHYETRDSLRSPGARWRRRALFALVLVLAAPLAGSCTQSAGPGARILMRIAL